MEKVDLLVKYLVAWPAKQVRPMPAKLFLRISSRRLRVHTDTHTDLDTATLVYLYSVTSSLHRPAIHHQTV